MCFHNSMSAKAQKLASRYNLKTDVVEIAKEILEEQRKYHVNAFANPVCPIIKPGNRLSFEKWGLIPHWVKTNDKAKEIRNMTLNARSETLFEKPSFRVPIIRNRCLIPSTGYFEYHHEGKETTPYFIFLKDEELFSIGGVSDIWIDPETGETIETFSLITTPANKLTGAIHNGGKNPGRMPLILLPEDEKTWLNPELSETEIKTLLKTFPETDMDAYPVSKKFNHMDPHNPEIIKKIA